MGRVLTGRMPLPAASRQKTGSGSDLIQKF
jgi:hypothetical protein